MWFLTLYSGSLLSPSSSPNKCKWTFKVTGRSEDGTMADSRTVSYSLCTDHRFRSFPEFLYQIVSLEAVLLGNNQVNLVDPCRLMKLVHLSTLDLSNNDLLKIPAELGLCTSLRYVWSTLLSTSCCLLCLCHRGNWCSSACCLCDVHCTLRVILFS